MDEIKNRKIVAQRKIINGLIHPLMNNADWDLRDLADIRFYSCSEEDDLSEQMVALANARKEIHFCDGGGDIEIHSPELADCLSKAVIKNEQTKLFPLLEEYREKGVKIYFFRIPSLQELEEMRALSENEQYRVDNSISGNLGFDKLNDGGIRQMKIMYAADYSKYREGLFARLSTLAGIGGLTMLEDVHLDGINVYDGNRYTVGNPEASRNKMYVFGPCTVGGAYVTDDETIPSHLQAFFNKDERWGGISVKNLGNCGFYRGYKEKLQALPISGSDIIIFIDHIECDFEEDKYKDLIVDLRECYLKSYDLFFDLPAHINAAGASVIASSIYDRLNTDGVYQHDNSEKVIQVPKINLSEDEACRFNEWLAQIPKNRETYNNAGSIVMNANPFTLGHRFLIERAVSETDVLYIFVVEENRSEFSFDERFRMVKSGCSGLDNVIVVPSGSFVLSYSTMPEYFEKEERPDKTVSASSDLLFFGIAVAPALGIRKRFVGEENTDMITRQYNMSMKRILQDYGVEVVEIKRKQCMYGEISASTVRRYIKEEKYARLKEFVPQTTWDILFERGKS